MAPPWELPWPFNQIDEWLRPHSKPHGVMLVVAVNYRRHRRGFWHRLFYPLKTYRRIRIMTDVTVGHQVVDTLVYLDQHGNPMQAPVTPDSPPVWANIAGAAVDTFTVSADGTTATLVATGPGVDSISVTVVVDGKTFSAVQQLTVNDVPQVLTSVDIQAVVA